ncbi:MAG: UDP-N-acetylmuramoyl-L-alanine--D-glutamate ligase [Methylococcales bacterium]
MKTDPTDNCAALASLGITPLSRVIVVGLGVTGQSVVRYLLQQGIIPTVVDSRQQPPALDQLRQDCQQQWSNLQIDTGTYAFDNLLTATHLIVSPGVSLKTPEIDQARISGVTILSDIDLFAAATSAPILAITGSNGKTTVTTLVGRMIECAGKKAAVGGNIGTPVLDLLQASKPDVYVLELSSFQLEITSHLQPTAAVVLNLSADHMDRYDNLAAYTDAKARIFNNTKVKIDNFHQPLQTLVGNTNHTTRNQRYFGLTDNTTCQFRIGLIDNIEWLIAYDQPLIKVSEIVMQGRHNLSNALAALALVDAINIQPSAAFAVLREFSGLPHRMENVRELHGVCWINDSKATNIGACKAALQGMSGRVLLIAGGDGKGADFSELTATVEQTVSVLILLGKDADQLQDTLLGSTTIHRVTTIEQAVNLAADMVQTGDTVLLSPACASLDQFENYQARGDAFKNAVMRLSP